MDRVPRGGVALAVAVLPDRAGNGSACSWQADERIIAHRGDCLKCHVAGPLDGPFVVLFEQQRTDQAHDGVVVWEDADDLCASLDLTVQSLNRVCRMEFGRRCHVVWL